MLKRSIKVRVNFDDDQVEEANAARMDAYNVFKRGVMEFDDYNYAIAEMICIYRAQLRSI